MKRINILLTIAFATLFVACSKQSLEDMAKERARSCVELLCSNDVQDFELHDFETVFNSDSACIIHFSAKVKTVYGETSDLPMEYYVLWTNRLSGKTAEGTDTVYEPELVECAYPVRRDGVKPLITRIKDFTEMPIEMDDKIVRVYACAFDSFRYRKVE